MPLYGPRKSQISCTSYTLINKNTVLGRFIAAKIIITNCWKNTKYLNIKA